ncbi:MAG: hypothetical protein JKY98_02560 [Gammaproteobacteria bacterium]|nr:hypothetical protein [Gammaproteobacteria bacterium]
MKNLIGGSLMALMLVLASCASTSNPAVGAWDISLITPLGAMDAVLTIEADGTGLMATDALGEAELSGIMVDGNNVTFTADIDAQGQQLSLAFTGMVDGDSISGEFGSDFGAFEVTGTRQ